MHFDLHAVGPVRHEVPGRGKGRLDAVERAFRHVGYQERAIVCREPAVAGGGDVTDEPPQGFEECRAFVYRQVGRCAAEMRHQV